MGWWGATLLQMGKATLSEEPPIYFKQGSPLANSQGPCKMDHNFCLIYVLIYG